MTHSRQERQKGRIQGRSTPGEKSRSGIGASISILQGQDEVEHFVKKAEDVWVIAQQFWGPRARGVLSAAFMVTDPMSFLRQNLQDLPESGEEEPPDIPA